MAGNLQPLVNNQRIVKNDGTPTDYFIRWAQQKQIDIGAGITAEQALEIITQYLADHELQAGSGIQITPSGNVSDNPTIAAEVQAILDQITNVRGSILFRGAAGWEALAPGTNGYFLKTNGDGGDPAWAASGGSGGGGWFKGATGQTGGASTAAFATKGVCFRPLVPLIAEAIWLSVDPAAVGNNYYCQLAEVTIPSFIGQKYAQGATVSAVLSTTATIAPGTTEDDFIRFPLPSPVALSDGVDYLLAGIFSQASGTAPARIGIASATSWEMNAPCETWRGSMQYDTVGLSSSQAVSSVGNGAYCLFLEGTLA